MSVEDDKVRIRMAEIMSSAGLGYNQIALEILYLLPKDFVDAYIAVWEQAFGSAGSGDRQGQQMDKDATLGKARGLPTKPTQARRGSGGGKKYKKFFVVRDEAAMELKGRMDRRLRNMGRDMKLFLDGSRIGETREEAALQCSRCGRIGGRGYRYCPFDGSSMAPDDDKKG